MDQESLAQIKQIITHATEAAETRLREEIQDVKRHTETRLREEIQDVKRYAGILIEQVEHKIDLLSEGDQSLHQQIEDVRSEIHQESQETRALLRASYQELRQRVEPLEQQRH
jgi:non-ribosomal peptide synthetase component F